jgi:tripeptide aminopeptidase
LNTLEQKIQYFFFELKYSMINTNRLLETFIGLARIDGTSGRELEVANHIQARLKLIGLAGQMDQAGDSFGGNCGNLMVKLPGTADAPGVLLCAHMDTILPTKRLNIVRKGDLIASDGKTILGADDRAGIAIILEILQVLKERRLDHGPVEVLFSVSEECGMHGSKSLAMGALEASMGFVFDSSAACGDFVVEAPAAMSFRILVRGKAAHAAISPEQGIHAIQIASRAIAALPLGRHGRTGMMNIGTIQGGKAINVIPDEVEILGETRSADPASLGAQMELLRESFEGAAAAAGGTVEIAWTRKYGGFMLGSAEPVVLAATRGIEAAGREARSICYPAGSDANVLNERGIPTVNLGLGTSNVHSMEESISLSSLTQGAEIGLGVVLELPRDRGRKI